MINLIRFTFYYKLIEEKTLKKTNNKTASYQIDIKRKYQKALTWKLCNVSIFYVLL